MQYCIKISDYKICDLSKLTIIMSRYVTAHAKLSHLSVKTYSCFTTYSNRAHSEQNDDTYAINIHVISRDKTL